MASSAVRTVKASLSLITHRSAEKRDCFSRGIREPVTEQSFLAGGVEAAVESRVGHGNSIVESCLLYFSADDHCSHSSSQGHPLSTATQTASSPRPI